MSYVVLSEAASSHIKEKTNLLASLISVLTTFVTSFTLPYLLHAPYAALGAKVGFIYGGICVIMVILAYFFIPELKGRSLEEVDQLFASGQPLRKLGSLTKDTTARQLDLIAKLLASTPANIQIGGGVRTEQDVIDLLEDHGVALW